MRKQPDITSTCVVYEVRYKIYYDGKLCANERKYDVVNLGPGSNTPLYGGDNIQRIAYKHFANEMTHNRKLKNACADDCKYEYAIFVINVFEMSDNSTCDVYSNVGGDKIEI